MKATEQYFPVVLFIMLYNVVLTFESIGISCSIAVAIKAADVALIFFLNKMNNFVNQTIILIIPLVQLALATFINYIQKSSRKSPKMASVRAVQQCNNPTLLSLETTMLPCPASSTLSPNSRRRSLQLS